MRDFGVWILLLVISLADGHWRRINVLGNRVETFPLPPKLDAVIVFVKVTEDRVDPPSPAFRITLKSTFFFGAFCFAAMLPRFLWPSPGSCISRESVYEFSVLYSSFWFSPDWQSGLCPRRSTPRRLVGAARMKWLLQNSKDTKRDENNQLNECLHFSYGQLELPTLCNHGPRNRATLCMGCVRASGAQGSNRRQPETTHEVFTWTRSRQPEASESR